MADKMADLRCQMCGKSNPGHSVECQYCGARLKPLVASSGVSEDTGANWTDASQEDTLGWLRSLGQDQDDMGGNGDTSDDLPDWLGASQTNASGTQPDWMSEVSGGARADSGEDNLDDFIEGEQEDDSASLPSWLSDKDDERIEKTVPLANLQEEDWLASIGNEDSLTATVTDWKQSPTTPKEEIDDLPGWLTPSPTDDISSGASDFEDDLPSWLSSGSSPPAQPEPSSNLSSDTELDGDFPDWFDSLNSKTGMTGKLGDMPQWIDEKESSSSDSGAPSFDWLATLGDTPEEEPNDWGKEIEKSARTRAGGALGGLTFDPEDSFISEVGNEQNPDWLQGLQETDTGLSGSSTEFSGFQSSWGFEEKPKAETWREPAQTDDEPVASNSVEDSGISGGLSFLVRAFQPIEGADIATEHTEGELERVGPLAGLRGLLTPEANIAKSNVPASHSNILQVSANQHTNTQLLQSLIEAENIPQPIPETSPLSSQSVLRIVFGVILILVMVFPLISGTNIIPLPQPFEQEPFPQELQAIENLSNSAPLDRPILVAFDYEPGLSGELEATTQALFNHWMERGIPLALVSTSPIGTGLGVRQVAYLMSKYPYNHNYVYGEDYVNLGYIAGGTAGLANFALIPRQSVKMAFDNRPIWQLLDYDASNPWLSPVMQPITTIADFFMTVVLTDNPETARNWIEQVEPALRRNSLVMVVSAQAEPFVRPYFQNADPAQRQVEGLLVGLRGGAWYEQAQGNFGLARLYWDAFGVGLLVAVILILAGGGYNYLDEMNKARKQARKGKPKK